MSFSVIDELSSVVGWSGTITVSLNKHEHLIAHNNAASIMLSVPITAGSTALKTVSFDATAYDKLVLNCCSVKNGKTILRNVSDAAYTIDFGYQKFYLNAPSKMGPIEFNLSGTKIISKIEITSLNPSEDFLFISNLQAVKKELKNDIANYFKSAITPSEYECGDISFTIGSTSATVLDPVYAGKYAKIRAGNYHYGIESVLRDVIEINSLFDGPTFKETYSGKFYLVPDVDTGSGYKEASIPAVTIWWDAEMIERVDNKYDYRVDSYTATGINDTVIVTGMGDFFRLPIQIDCESQYKKILTELELLVKKIIDKRAVWVYGVKLQINFVSSQLVDSEYDKMSFILDVECVEESWQETQRFPMSWTDTITINPVKA